MNILLACETFDDKGGRPSGYCNKLHEEILQYDDVKSVSIINGGQFEYLQETIKMNNYMNSFNVIMWFADVPNDRPKLIRDIKKINKTCILITSKNNIDRKYNYLDLVSRALENKANLLIEFTKENDIICGTIIDPLGNCFGRSVKNIDEIANIVLNRTYELLRYTRVGCKNISRELIPAPKETAFFNKIQKSADTFHELIPCGATEEVSAIYRILPWPNAEEFAINLRGHGSLVASSTLYGITKNVPYTSRPIPEPSCGLSRYIARS